ncbi:dihydrofolate reductase-like domain-containing protein, partial [Dioszegia hungarica]
RPYLTLTWAQSLDAKIAGPRGARVILSGKESMEMTHWMRAMHHGIVIGVNTLLLDNPRLQVNLLPPALNLSPPAIFILDPNLRTPTSARILTEWTTHMHIPGQTTAARPTILCGAHMVWTARYRELEAAGAAIFGMQLDKNGHIPPQGLVSIFTSLGIRSAMIEGGSRVISSFLHAPKREDGSAMIDSVVVTVAPMFIGDGV